MSKALRENWPLAWVIFACGLIFLADLFIPGVREHVTLNWLLYPAKVSSAWEMIVAGQWDVRLLPVLGTLLGYAFLHADIGHIGMNLLFIWVFGTLVFRELGAGWFFITYVVAAVCGGIGQVLLEPYGSIPTLGASGALMGLEGMYLGMALRWRLPNPDVWPIAEPIPQERLMILAVFGVLMDVSGVVGQSGGIAYGAHLGGFISGLFLGTVVIPRPRNAQ